jgi:hypothetical protein
MADGSAYVNGDCVTIDGGPGWRGAGQFSFIGELMSDADWQELKARARNSPELTDAENALGLDEARALIGVAAVAQGLRLRPQLSWSRSSSASCFLASASSTTLRSASGTRPPDRGRNEKLRAEERRQNRNKPHRHSPNSASRDGACIKAGGGACKRRRLTRVDCGAI